MTFQQFYSYVNIILIMPAAFYSIYLAYGRIRKMRQIILDQQDYIRRNEVHYRSLGKYYVHLSVTLSDLQQEKLSNKWNSIAKTPAEAQAHLTDLINDYRSIQADHIIVTTDMKQTIEKFIALGATEPVRPGCKNLLNKLLKLKNAIKK